MNEISAGKPDELTESQEEDVRRNALNKGDPMLDDDTMRSGRSINEIDVAEETDDEEDADAEEGTAAGDDTTGPVKKKVKEMKARNK